MITNKPIDIEDAHADIVQNALKKHLPEGVRVYAFGSRATWQAKRASDLDLAIDADATLKKAIENLEEELSQSDLPYKVDIVNLNTIADSFRNAITPDLVPILWDWVETTLGEIVDSNLYTVNKDYPHDMIQYLDTGSITCGKIDGFQKVALNDAPSRAKRLVQDSDIIYSTVRPIQRHYGFIKNPPDNLVVSTGFSVITAKDKVYPPYLYYFLTSDDTTEVLDVIAEASTSAYPSLKPSDIEAQEISLPPLPEQKAIASVLSCLDDKIDLLHRQNKTLESTAETLFRQWFIEEVQDDWEEKPLDKIANYLNGLACQKYPPKNEVDKLPVLKIKDLRGGLSEASDWASNDVAEEYIVENGDVIFSWSGSLLVKIWDGKTCILNQHLFKVTSNQYPKWFIYLWTNHHLRKFTAIAESKATTMGHIKRADLASSMAAVPSDPEIEDMSKTMAPIIEKIILNNNQISKLESLRDNLLPKLMSGAVRVEFEDNQKVEAV